MGKIRRESGETSVFRGKTLAQGRFTRPEQVQSPKGKRPEVRTQQKNHDLSRGFFVGGPDRIRTDDTRFRRAVLYPLSYGGMLY